MQLLRDLQRGTEIDIVRFPTSTLALQQPLMFAGTLLVPPREEGITEAYWNDFAAILGDTDDLIPHLTRACFSHRFTD